MRSPICYQDRQHALCFEPPSYTIEQLLDTALCGSLSVNRGQTMANIVGPFGFAQWGTASGPVNYAENHSPQYRIASTYTTAIFYGDAVRLWVSGDTSTSSAGYIIQWTAADGSATKILSGIFVGCSYYSTSQRKRVYNNYWPGSDATGDVDAYIVDDPNALFKVQAATGPITQASIGFGADIASTPLGNTTTGISTMALTTPSSGSAATLPFKVVNVLTSPPGANGTDLTTAYNYVIVSLNNQQYKTQTGA